MKCPFCNGNQIKVVNSRDSGGATQIWRRRKCLDCGKLFTTHEVMDLKHLIVIKKDKHAERYVHAKLFSGIYKAAISARRIDRVGVTERATNETEKLIVGYNKKEITTDEIAQTTMRVLAKMNFGVFLRYLTYYVEVADSSQLLRELKKYIKGYNF